LTNFAERLKELRIEAGLKQEELGEKIGVQRMTFYRWENGSNPPSNENLLLLAQLFNTSTLYLRGDIDDRDMVLTDSLQSILDEMRQIRYIEHPNTKPTLTPFVGDQVKICEAFGFDIPD